MTQIHKITAVPNAATGALAESLRSNGFNRFPGAIVRKVPYLEIDGDYRTGLDENALYIKKMAPEEAEVEKAYVNNLYKMAKEMYGNNVDLSPKSDFYHKMLQDGNPNSPRCPWARFEKDTTEFHITENKEDLIVYAYMRVRPDVAPSKEDAQRGQYAHATYFVDDENLEDEKTYKIKTLVAKAIVTLESLSLERRKKVGRQLGLNLTDNTSEATTYKLIDDYIKLSEAAKSRENAEKFLKFAEMKAENLEIRDVIHQATLQNVLRKKADGTYWRGENLFGKDYESVVAKLTDEDNQDDLLSIQDELKMKKAVKA